MIRRRWSWLWLAAVVVLSALVAGCGGPSQEEWEAKLKEVNDLKAQLATEKEQHAKYQKQYEDAKAQIEDLKEKLAKAGGDVEASTLPSPSRKRPSKTTSAGPNSSKRSKSASKYSAPSSTNSPSSASPLPSAKIAWSSPCPATCSSTQVR